MNKKRIVIALCLGLLGLGAAISMSRYTKHRATETAQEAGYWTCSMHPQVHQSEPGSCPICHMKLIYVEHTDADKPSQHNDHQASLHPTRSQLELSAIQPTTVEKKRITLSIPVSGRFLSPKSVAFQIYESDLRYVRPGVSFTGSSSIYPEVVLSGVISSVDPTIDPTSRTVRITGSIVTNPKKVLPETGFKGSIAVELPISTVIPEDAVLHSGAGELVYILTAGGELIPRQVSLGAKADGFYQVLHGVEPGEVISSGPNFLLDSESRLKGIR